MNEPVLDRDEAVLILGFLPISERTPDGSSNWWRVTMARKKKPKIEPYVTDEQIRSVLDRAWAKLHAQQEADAKAAGTHRTASES